MAIQRIRKVPDELPHARLYLDDVEEISKILLESHAVAAAEHQKEAKVIYSMGDVRMDSVDDLQTYCGSARNLKIEVNLGGWSAGTVQFHSGFYSLLQPSIYIYALRFCVMATEPSLLRPFP